MSATTTDSRSRGQVHGVAGQPVSHPPAVPAGTSLAGTRLERALARATRAGVASLPPQEMLPAGLAGLSDREAALVSFDALGMRPHEAASAAGLPFSEARSTRLKPAYGVALRAQLNAAASDANALAVATRAGRIGSLSARWEALRAIIEQRACAADPRYLNPDRAFLANEMKLDPDDMFAKFPYLGELYDPENPACHMCDPTSFLVPGASTGMMIRRDKVIGAGLSARQVVEWEVDNSIVVELRAIEKAMAVETGQDTPADTATKVWVNIDLERLGAR